jgi:RND family efflux transporter MFP subunit
MKKIIFTLIIGSLLFSCSNNKEPQSADEIRNQIKEYKSEIKGLTKKIAKLEENLAAIDENGESTNSIRVNVLKLEPQKFEHYFMATGSVKAENEAYISPQTNGQITNIYVEEGDKIKKGQLLANLNTEIIERNIDEVKVNLELAETVYKKQKELWEKQIGSELQYLQAKSNYKSLQSRLKTLRSQYNLSFIKSPLNGVVDEVYQKVGEMGTPGMRLIHVVSLNPLLVKANISEKYIPVIKIGDEIGVAFPTFPGMEIKASIYRIGNVINPANRTFTVELKLDNPEFKIKPNMLATIIIKDYSSDNAVVTPSYLIREDLKGKYIYIAKEESGKLTATKQYIKTGHSYKGNTEIISGLQPGSTIITEGYNNVSDGVTISTQ